MALISVVIPVFNRSASAERAAISALEQKGLGADKLEVIVVDDGSSPPLGLPSLAGRVVVVRLNPNAGPAGARNAGIRASRGDYIAFLDSDDVWLPQKLARQLAELRGAGTGDGDLVVSACGFYYPNRRSGRVEGRIPMRGVTALDFASGCWAAPGTTLVVPRGVFDRIGVLDETLRRLEDYDWLLRFGLAGGRLEVARVMGAVIAPSGLARSKIVSQNVQRLEEKFGRTGSAALTGALSRRFRAYMALERGAASLSDAGKLEAAIWLSRSLLLKPRGTGALLPFWEINAEVPVEVQDSFKALASAGVETAISIPSHVQQ